MYAHYLSPLIYPLQTNLSTVSGIPRRLRSRILATATTSLRESSIAPLWRCSSLQESPQWSLPLLLLMLSALLHICYRASPFLSFSVAAVRRSSGARWHLHTCASASAELGGAAVGLLKYPFRCALGLHSGRSYRPLQTVKQSFGRHAGVAGSRVKSPIRGFLLLHLY